MYICFYGKCRLLVGSLKMHLYSFCKIFHCSFETDMTNWGR
uniref:Uncharacterized protein n=1 Tax=Anguilla anguilla TaxID=7936 RepID=A0A0E9VIE8_ANGAN